MPEVVRKLLGELEYSEIFIEEGNPSTEIGLNHDIYVNNSNYEVFKKINNIWISKGFCGDANINPDWDETDTTKKSYILNKPDVATKDLLQSLEESLNININDLESLIKAMGVIGFNYDEQEHTVTIVRPNNSVDEGMTFPVCDGLKPGFIDVDTFLQVQQNKKDLIDINENLVNKANKSELHNVALSGDYEELENKPDLNNYYKKDELFELLGNTNSYGTCTTAAATVAKVGNLEGFSLVTGARIFIKFTLENTASNPTLDVNNTGAKSIMYEGVNINPRMITAGHIAEFIYDGSNWELLNPKLVNYGTCSTVAATVAKVGTLVGFKRYVGVRVSILFTYANTATNPTLNVNGSGTAYINCHGKNIIPGMIGANHTADFVFNGSQWVLLNPIPVIESSESAATSLSNANPNVPVSYPDS